MAGHTGVNSTDSSNSISNYIVQSWFIFRVHFDRAEMLGQIVQALMVEMVRAMNIFADSGTAGTDFSFRFVPFRFVPFRFAKYNKPVRVTTDMLIITEIPGLCKVLGHKGDFRASQLKIQKTVVLI